MAKAPDWRRDGDAIPDFSNASGVDSEPDRPESGPAITTLVAPSVEGDLPVAVESAQPVEAGEVDLADMDNDGDAELIVAEVADELFVLDWNGAELETVQILGLGQGYYAGALGTLHAGRLAANGLGGVFVGGVPGLHNRVGATFVEGVEPSFAEQDARLVADFNDDGVDDFYARDGFIFLSKSP